jgi:hypothetical protein
MTHPAIGHHQMLNEYLTNYIQERKLLAWVLYAIIARKRFLEKRQ